MRAFLLALQASGCTTGDINLGLRGDAGEPIDGGSSTTVPDAAETRSEADAGNATHDASGPSGLAGEAGTASADASSNDGGTDAMARDSGGSSASQLSSGCGTDPPASEGSIQVGGMRGTFIVDLPAGYNKTQGYPLIIAFRGANVTAAAFRGYLNLATAARNDAIVVNPDCLNDATTWDVARDLPFFDALLNRLESSYCVDHRRVFATGHGTGGSFASTLGCVRGNKLRAVAPLSGGPPPTGACQAAPSVWISQGNLDTMLGAGRANREFWVQRSKCDVKRSVPVAPSPCVEYADCDPESSVRYCEYDGDFGLPNFATDGLWEFFKGL